MAHRNLNRRFRKARKRSRKATDGQEFARELRKIHAIQDREAKENNSLDSADEDN